VLKDDLTIRLGKKCVVFANTYVGPWIVLGAALTNDDVAGRNAFTAETLDTQATTR